MPNLYGVLASRYRRQGSGQATIIDGNPVIQTKGENVYLDGNRSASGSGGTWSDAYITFAEAVAALSNNNNDKIHVAPYSSGYDEVEINFSKAGLTVIGHGPIGSVFIHNTTAGGNGAKITADDITHENIGIEGDDTAEYALSVGTGSDDVHRFRSYDCKYELGAGANEALRLWGCSDVRIIRPEFAWAGIGVMFRGNLTGYATQIRILKGYFQNLTAQWIAQHEAGADDNGKVVNLILHKNSFDNLEDGTVPTGVSIELDHTGTTGQVTNNHIAAAEHASAKIALASGVHYTGNWAEEGVNVARPD